MNKLFNRSFLKFTVGFASIVLLSMLIGAVITDMDTRGGATTGSAVGE